MIRQVVIPSAGIGTRLLPATKEQPKEMLPVFVKGANGELCLKPLLHVVFENLYDIGLREFCFITGRGKRSIEDYFTIDSEFINYLRSKGKLESTRELDIFYEKVQESTIVFVNQSEPRGLGDAVYHAKPFTGKEPFLVHAGDDLIISEKNQYLTKLVQVFEKRKAAAVFCVEKVKDPRNYGVVVGEKVGNCLYKVKRVIEKPSAPPSDLAIVAVYVFDSKLYEAIEKTPIDKTREVQLTNAIQYLIDKGNSVYGVELSPREMRVDIGTPQSYLRAVDMMVKSRGM